MIETSMQLLMAVSLAAIASGSARDLDKPAPRQSAMAHGPVNRRLLEFPEKQLLVLVPPLRLFGFLLKPVCPSD